MDTTVYHFLSLRVIIYIHAYIYLKILHNDMLNEENMIEKKRMEIFTLILLLQHGDNLIVVLIF